jgi:hypothetical protein
VVSVVGGSGVVATRKKGLSIYTAFVPMMVNRAE